MIGQRKSGAAIRCAASGVSAYDVTAREDKPSAERGFAKMRDSTAAKGTRRAGAATDTRKAARSTAESARPTPTSYPGHRGLLGPDRPVSSPRGTPHPR